MLSVLAKHLVSVAAITVLTKRSTGFSSSFPRRRESRRDLPVP